MNNRLHLSSKYRAVVEALLRAHLPGIEVWAYGSRVNGRGHDGSDLDLVLRGPGLKEIPAGQFADFQEAVQDSTIPFLVEARDWTRLPEQFQREIERRYVVLVDKDKSDSSDDGWVTLRLGDVCRKIGSGATPRGGKEVYLEDGPCSLIRSQNVYNNRFSRGGLAFITEQQSTELSNVEVLPDDVLLNITGDSVARACQVTPDALPARVNQHVAIIRPDASKLSARFLRYFLVSPKTQTLLLSWAGSGGTRNALTKGMIESLHIYAPADVSEQRAIAHILGTLDDKIELNRRMNETLEAMARALFKSWFVDFDPVRAKAALRTHATHRADGLITPPLRGSRGDKGASPQASRRGDSNAPQPPRPWPEIKRQYTSKALHHAQAMRQNQTSSEGLLWYYLRNKQLGGYKFRRQQPIGPYIADFACLPEKLLIELDGGQHADPNAPDEQRDQFLRQRGYRVLRFWNHEVFADCFGVLERVYEALTDPPPPQPAPDGLASATPPQGGSDWSVERARAYLNRMDPEIVELFSDCFVDSGMGDIPEGWRVGVLDDMVELLGGGTPRTSVADYWDGAIPWYTAKDAPSLTDIFVLTTERGITQLGVENSATTIFPVRTTIITARGTVGRLACLGVPMAMNQSCYGVRGADAYPDFFTYWVIRAVVDELRMRTHGTIFDTITRQTFKVIERTLVPVYLARVFEMIVTPVMDRILRNQNGSRTLAAVRDALLPEVLSGNVGVREYCHL